MISKQLEELYWHDSQIRTIQILFPRGHDRVCILDVDYYDWEGNEKRRESNPKSDWAWKHLRLTFGYLAHMEYSAPDLINRVQDIDSISIGKKLDPLRQRVARVKEEFPQAKVKLFDSGTEPISLKFHIQNGTEDQEGYILVIGSQVRMRWIEDDHLTGQVHIPCEED